ncbi:MAG: ABC transporter ATP-binding protein [Candidatus Bathyarchaeia archaeon]
MEYVIETVHLVKRYPTSVPPRRGIGDFSRGPVGGPTHGHGGPTSFGAIFRILRGGKSAFVEALRGIDLKIREGEIFGVLGPNGAGKTTLIKILCTLVTHDEGEAYVCGFDVKKEPDKVLRKLQAVLSESRGFAWRLSGRQNLEFYALLYGLRKKEADERIDFLLELTGLKERENDMYQRYSTGMQRRLLLCRAMLQDTPILLFDEPTAGLDPTGAAEFRGMLRRLAAEQRKTILLSTHNLQEAQSLCTRIAILDRGRIIACDTPDNIRHAIFEENIFDIMLADTCFNDEKIKMMYKLKEIAGVNSVTPEVDMEGNFKGLSIRADKNVDISEILEVVMKSGLKIRAVNTKEPTLEDAFIAMTGRLCSQKRTPVMLEHDRQRM